MISSDNLARIQAAVDDYGLNHWLKKKIYRNLFTKPWHALRIAAVCGSIRGDTILDVACASGELTDEIRKAAKPSRIVGFEGCGDVIEFGRKLYPEIEFVKGLVESLPFEDKSFDAVHAGEIIEHVSDPDAFVERLARITRRQLIISTPADLVRDPGHVAIFTEAALRSLLERHFESVKIVDADRTFVAVAEGLK